MTVAVPRSRALDASEFAASVEDFLRQLLVDEAQRWSAAVLPGGQGAWAGVEELYGYLSTAILSAGKRLRPRFCYLGHMGVAGGSPDDGLVRAAAALELLHAFALVHDDVMDGSSTRRGGRSLHAMLDEEHKKRGWRGERRRVAEGTAILVGDFAFTLAHRLAGALPSDAQRVWHDTCAELVVGQRLDMYGTTGAEREPAYARLVAGLKSGRYTVAGPLLLGAALAGGGEDHRAAYRAYGEPLGEAFQLRDDLLGVFGDPAVTGKPVGDDLREGKPTLLLALATERADVEQRQVLDLVGGSDLGDRDIDRIATVLVRTGARDEVEQRIGVAARQAVSALDGGAVGAGAAAGLRRAAEQAAWRDK